MAPAETPTPNPIPAAAIATSTTEEKTIHVELLPATESEAEQSKTKTIPPPKPETLESTPNSVSTKEVANTEEKKPPVKAQQSPQQQPEKTDGAGPGQCRFSVYGLFLGTVPRGPSALLHFTSGVSQASGKPRLSTATAQWGRA